MEIVARRVTTATLALLMISWGCGEGLTGPPETAGRDVDAFVASRGCRVDGCSGGGDLAGASIFFLATEHTMRFLGLQ